MSTSTDPVSRQTNRSGSAMLIVAWLWVGVPLAWGIFSTVLKSKALFR